MIPIFVYLVACGILDDGATFGEYGDGFYVEVNIHHIVGIGDYKPQAKGFKCSLVMTTAGRRYFVGAPDEIMKAIDDAIERNRDRLCSETAPTALSPKPGAVENPDLAPAGGKDRGLR